MRMQIPRATSMTRACVIAAASFFAGALLVPLAGCAPTVKVAAPVTKPLHLTISAVAALNPDPQGRASPVVLRIYVLGADGEFTGADFFALYQNEATALPHSLISRQELLIAPGESTTLDLTLPHEAHFVGVLAAYRDVDKARWRAIAPARGKTASITLTADTVSIAGPP